MTDRSFYDSIKPGELFRLNRKMCYDRAMSKNNVVAASRKILVAVDGSVYSNNAIRYLCSLFAGIGDVRFHLFGVVVGGVPEVGREWLDEQTLMTTLSQESRNRYSRLQRFCREAAARMERCGVPPGNVTSEVVLSRGNVAQDILHAARHGLYDALVIGRRGLSKIEELFMGSVSATILGKCHDVPVWVVDKTVESKKILVPVDGSFHSLLAVDHLAHMIHDNSEVEVTLFHSSAMLASKTPLDIDRCAVHWGREWCDRYLDHENRIYEAPRQLLIQAGFPAERISWQHVFKGIEAARQIIRHALVEDFGTIVMGRRGEDSRRGLLHSVSDRVVFMADQVAIWVVG